MQEELKIKAWQREDSDPYIPVEVEPLLSELTEQERYATRLLLINNPGLMQVDVADSLDIHRFSLERCSTKPEEVELEDEEVRLLASTALGYVVLDRRQKRIEIAENRALILKTILSPRELRVLPFLHKRNAEIAKNTNYSSSTITRCLKDMEERLGLSSRTEVVLWAQSKGVDYDLPVATTTDRLTIREREVSVNLVLTNKKISELLNLTDAQVIKAINGLHRKTGTTTREELALFAQKYSLKPSPEDYIIKLDCHPALAPFHPRQREALKLLHLSRSEIAEAIDINVSAVNNLLSRAREMSSTNSDIELALKLCDDGFSFDIKKPVDELYKILSSQQLDVVRLAGRHSDEIARALGITPNRASSALSYAQTKLKARSRVEVALMVREFDSGKEHIDKKERDVRLLEDIGLVGLAHDQIKEYIKSAVTTKAVTARQAECIEAYFFDKNSPSWRDVGSNLKPPILGEAAFKTAQAGIRNLKNLAS